MPFRFRSDGEIHEQGNPNCPGCQNLLGTQYPRPHSDFGRECGGLVHGETLGEKDERVTIYGCDICPRGPQDEVRVSIKEVKIPKFHNN